MTLDSSENYWAALSGGAVYNAVQGGSNLWVCGWNSNIWPFEWKLLSSAFLMLYKVVLVTFESVDEILKCDNYSNKSYWAVLSYGAVYYAVQGGSNFRVCRWNPKVCGLLKWNLFSITFIWCCLFLDILQKLPLVFFLPSILITLGNKMDKSRIRRPARFSFADRLPSISESVTDYVQMRSVHNLLAPEVAILLINITFLSYAFRFDMYAFL